jgi:hypothetical protein
MTHSKTRTKRRQHKKIGKESWCDWKECWLFHDRQKADLSTAQIAALEAKEKENIKIEKPHGEAGDRNKGFVLIEAMGLDDERAMYASILVCV